MWFLIYLSLVAFTFWVHLRAMYLAWEIRNEEPKSSWRHRDNDWPENATSLKIWHVFAALGSGLTVLIPIGFYFVNLVELNKNVKFGDTALGKKFLGDPNDNQ